MSEYNGTERRKQNYWPAVAFVVLAFFAGWANLQAFTTAKKAEDAVAQIEMEGKDRRDQICRSAEREHLNSVEKLRSTYKYLLDASPAEQESSLYRIVRGGLRQTEAEAHNDVAPEFCDEPNVGLPEPDPKVPERPELLTK